MATKDTTAGKDPGEQGKEDPDIKKVDTAASDDTKDAPSTTEEPTGKTDSKKDTGDDTSGSDTDWEGRYKGLQPKYQTVVEARKVEKESWDAERLKLLGQVSEADTALKGAQDAVKTLTDEAEESGTGKKEMQEQIDTLGKQLTRNNLIMSEYPDLALFEAKGQLRTDVEGEELVTALDEFRKLMGLTTIDALKDLSAGDTGDEDLTSGNRSQGDDLNSLQEQLMQANIDGDPKEIRRITDLLVTEQQKVFEASGSRG